MLLGVHCSIAGGAVNAIDEAKAKLTDTFQIFTKNQRQWKNKVIDKNEGAEFQTRMKSAGIKLGFSHSIYLINLGSADPTLWSRSVKGLFGEIERCETLGLAYTVLHPGSAKDISEEEAIENIVRGLKLVLEHSKGYKTMILLENTAGQGSSIGYDFKQIQRIMEKVGSDRIGMCFDTCHAFAAGYDISTSEGFTDTFDEIDALIGLERLKAIHLNDSKFDLGSRVDRHEHIGQGKIGIEPFKLIMQNYQHIPKVLETPKANEMDLENLKLLRSFVKNN